MKGFGTFVRLLGLTEFIHSLKYSVVIVAGYFVGSKEECLDCIHEFYLKAWVSSECEVWAC